MGTTWMCACSPKKSFFSRVSGRERISRVFHRTVLVDTASISAAYLSTLTAPFGQSAVSLSGSIVMLNSPLLPSSMPLTSSREVQVANLRGAQIDDTISFHLRHVRTRMSIFWFCSSGTREKTEASSSTGSRWIGAMSCERLMAISYSVRRTSVSTRSRVSMRTMWSYSSWIASLSCSRFAGKSE